VLLEVVSGELENFEDRQSGDAPGRVIQGR
jgi:hypothetical protein